MGTKDKNSEKRYAITMYKAWSLSKEWLKAALIWRALDHFFVLGSFTASVGVVYIVAAFPDSQILVIILSSVAAVLTLMGFACNPAKYMINYRKAFEVLNAALISNTDMEGKLIDEKVGRKQIAEAIRRGEQYIGRTFNLEIDDEEEK